MIASGDIRALLTFTKDLVSDQTATGLIESPTTSGAFDATEGFGRSATGSSVGFLVLGLGGADQRVTATMRHDAATSDRCGVMARVNNETTGSQNMYYANIDTGTAKLQKNVNSGTLSTISSSAFAAPVGSDITIELTCIGGTITATFTCAGVPGSPLTLSGAEDASIPRSGSMGWKTLSKPGWCRSITAEQL